jgi:hypothetical protein
MLTAAVLILVVLPVLYQIVIRAGARWGSTVGDGSDHDANLVR